MSDSNSFLFLSGNVLSSVRHVPGPQLNICLLAGGVKASEAVPRQDWRATHLMMQQIPGHGEALPPCSMPLTDVVTKLYLASWVLFNSSFEKKEPVQGSTQGSQRELSWSNIKPPPNGCVNCTYLALITCEGLDRNRPRVICSRYNHFLTTAIDFGCANHQDISSAGSLYHIIYL